VSESTTDAELDPAAAAAVIEHREQRLRRLRTEVGIENGIDDQVATAKVLFAAICPALRFAARLLSVMSA
jgi:hypothetical protein